MLLRVWDKFHEHGIEIPFPQRDLHLIPPVDLNVTLGGKGEPLEEGIASNSRDETGAGPGDTCSAPVSGIAARRADRLE